MFKYLTLVSVLLLVLSVIVCGNDSQSPPPPTPPPPSRAIAAKQFRYVDNEDEEPSPRPPPPPTTRNFNSRQQQQQPFPGEDPGYDGTTQGPGVVNVDGFGNGINGKTGRVGVDVGPFFNMDLQRNKTLGSQGINLALEVLSGLVRVRVQRERDPWSNNYYPGGSNQKRGPIVVEVGGQTIYSSPGRRRRR
ncbi:uncharacterized protein LOC128953550 [Oppia nitens]|uniref:uncharacterized protein LOC128953550 n=1 Tax=Oppia nitens TaxID=1686743 RepID=UPI0023D9E9F4|nr:uncharacterized protein LOC128953550 [Oppia nitens]